MSISVHGFWLGVVVTLLTISALAFLVPVLGVLLFMDENQPLRFWRWLTRRHPRT